nr:p2X purinoceptor 4 [Hymenolepis microstoma]
MFQYWENDTRRVPLIYDAAEIVNPPLENNAFFIMTHSIVTPMQKPSRCPTLRGNKKSQCRRDTDCGSVQLSIAESGVRTGKCIDYINGVGVCEIYGWCPVENDEIVIDYDLNKRFEMISNYTVYIKNDIEFPNFGVKRKNRDAWTSDKPLGSCRYNPSHPVDKYCPIFKFSTIFKEVGLTPKALTRGGVIGILIDWECDLDLGANHCNPKYRFTNLDVESDGNSGFNFRYALRYRENGTIYRDLVKTFGFRFSIFVHGRAGRFSIIPLLLNLGSGLALLSIAPTICDIIILNIVGKKGIYKEAKFEVLTRDEVQQRALTKKISQSHSKNNICDKSGLSPTINSGPSMTNLEEGGRAAP